jgi:DNA-binding NarL/FixJ family response regulator
MPRQLPLRTLVADDHRLFRQGLISLMNARPDLVTVLGEAENGMEVIEMCRRLNPDLIMMDIFMPQMNGLQAAKHILETHPDTAIVMLTASASDEHLKNAIELGVSGYLLKNLDANELFGLVVGVSRDEVAITPAIASRVMRNIGFGRRNQEHEKITARELEVLKLAAVGDSNLQIAASLQISVNTVKAHLKSILEKLNLENRTQLAAYAAQKGLVTRKDNLEDYSNG